MERRDLEERVRILETRAGRARAVAAAAVLAVAGLAAAGFAETDDEVVARRFVLRGADGKDRVVIAEEKGTAGLSVLDDSGEVRAAIRIGEKGRPEVAVMDGEEQTRAVLTVMTNESGGLVLRDGKGRIRGWFVTAKDQPVLDLMGENEKTRIGLSVLDKGSAGISLFNADTAVRAGLVHNPDDSVRLSLRTGPNDDEKTLLEAKAWPSGAASVTATDLQGRSKAVLGVMPDGSAGVTVAGPDDKPRISLAALAGVDVLQMCDSAGAKLVEIHAVDEKVPPKGFPVKTPTASVILKDSKGTETFRAPKK